MRTLTSLLFLVASTAACATDATQPPAPAGDGHLVSVTDRIASCNDGGHAGWTCGLDVTLSGTQLTAVGTYNDGSKLTAPVSATLTPAAAAHLAEVIAQVADEGPAAVTCGSPPLRFTRIRAAYGELGQLDLDINHPEGAVQQLDDYALQILVDLRTCKSSERLTIGACAPNSPAIAN